MKRRNPIGVMQGRLLPKYQGRYQAHPVDRWADEFPKAAACGLDCIEFILDFADAEANPLLRPGGPDEIRRAIDETGVKVQSVCVDYLMEAPLHHPDESVASSSCSIVQRLLEASAALGVTELVVPCVDRSALLDRAAEDRLVGTLFSLVEKAELTAINLCLETDLAPQRFAELLDRFDTGRVTVNYDIGNSAALGFDPAEELACYGDRISDIHIKDRLRGAGSVLLGTGDARFDRFFESLRTCDFRGPFIMQAYRDDEGEEIFKRQLTWMLERYLEPLWT